MGLIYSNDFKYLIICTCCFCLLQLMSTSPSYFIFKPHLNRWSASLSSAASSITVILAMYNITQSKVNRQLVNLRISLPNVNMNEGYATQSKLKTSSPLHWVGESNLLPLQTIYSNQSEEALASAAPMISLLSPNNNSFSMY